MGLSDLGDKKKEETKDEKRERIGVDDIDDFEELKDRVGNISQRLMMAEKQIDDLEDDVETLTTMIEGVFTLMRGDGELVEVVVKDKKEEEETTGENKWAISEGE